MVRLSDVRASTLRYCVSGMNEVTVTVRKFAAPLGVALALALATPAAAQRDRSGEAEVQRLIDQLQPGTTRGIRVPAEPAPARPESAAPQERVAAPARPAPPRPAPTTAPQGVPAVSLTVLFASGSATLTPQAERELDALGRALVSPQLAPYRFRIEGHTDTVGPRDMNQALSEQRAASVRQFLVQRYGVQPERLDAIGIGEDQPLVRTPDETPERRNRRVQVLNLGS